MLIGNITLNVIDLSGCISSAVIPVLSSLQEKLLGAMHRLDGGLIHKALRDPTKAAHRQGLLKLMSRALGLAEGEAGQRYDPQGLKEMEVHYLIYSPISESSSFSFLLPPVFFYIESLTFIVQEYHWNNLYYILYDDDDEYEEDDDDNEVDDDEDDDDDNQYHEYDYEK